MGSSLNEGPFRALFNKGTVLYGGPKQGDSNLGNYPHVGCKKVSAMQCAWTSSVCQAPGAPFGSSVEALGLRVYGFRCLGLRV